MLADTPKILLSVKKLNEKEEQWFLNEKLKKAFKRFSNRRLKKLWMTYD